MVKNTRSIKISPSVLACDFARLGEEISAVLNAGADYIHWDVMDGQFVTNITFGMPVIRSLRSHTDAVFDVHLMVVDAIRYVADFAKAGADIITVHVEAEKDIVKTLLAIRECSKKSGVALSPETSLDSLTDECLRCADMVLIMTVKPGFGGQKYIDATDKIIALKKRIESLGLTIDIQVDGGIASDTIGKVANAGANIFVAGSAIFGQSDYRQVIQDLRDAVECYGGGDS